MTKAKSKTTKPKPAAKAETVLSEADEHRLKRASVKLSSVGALTRVLLHHFDSRGQTAAAAASDREEVLQCIGDMAEEAWKLVADVYDPKNREAVS